jgi:hypothetical protein
MKLYLLLPLILLGLGCESQQSNVPTLPRKITSEEYRKMTPDEQSDPFVLQNLEKPPTSAKPKRP